MSINTSSNIQTTGQVSQSILETDWSKSVESIYAQLQYELGQGNKEKAVEKIKEIKESQATSKAYTEVINILRSLKSAKQNKAPDFKNGFPLNEKEWKDLPYRKYDSGSADEFFYGKMKLLDQARAPNGQRIIDMANLKFPSYPSVDEYDTYIAQLQSCQEQVGTDIQQQMVMIQDYMGQYTSYQSGATSALQKGAENLQTVARLR